MAFGVGEGRVCLVCEAEGVVPVRECPEGYAEEEQGGHGGGSRAQSAECRAQSATWRASRLSPSATWSRAAPLLTLTLPARLPPTAT